MAGVAELPQASDINGCDAKEAEKSPAETPVNPAECRTSADQKAALADRADQMKAPKPVEHWSMAEEQAHIRTAEIDRRLSSALHDAGRSPLGMPGTVDTLKAMLARAGLVLVLA